MKGGDSFAMALGLLLVGFGTLAWAGASEEGSDQSTSLPSFEEADKDGDGKLSMEEAKAVGLSEETFKEEDLDGDGQLTEYDYRYGVK